MLSNPILDLWLDSIVWTMLFSHFYPFELATKGDDVDQYISSFSLNGMKSR